MRFKKVAISAIAMLGVVAGLGSSATYAAAPKLLWSDEFNAKKVSALSSKVWDYDIGDGYGWGNSEQEYYTKLPANVKVNGQGQLEINALRLQDTDPITDRCFTCQFSSAKIKTAGKLGFKYGHLEARIQLPAGQGMWPAFWMLGAGLLKGGTWPDVGEIDIMEARGARPNDVLGTLHGPGYSGQNGTMRTMTYSSLNNLQTGYHVYAIDWLKDSIAFSIDGMNYFTQSASDVAPNKWVFNNEFYLILNLATGGNFDPNLDPALQSAQMKVDYIRYYTYKGQGSVIVHK
jgi:beta-glucanase (GH16 family)